VAARPGAPAAALARAITGERMNGADGVRQRYRRTHAKGEIMPRAQIKDEKMYQELRKKGESKEKAARIANASARGSRSAVGKKGGKSPSYGEWTKNDLLKRARDIGIHGRSTMTKDQLVHALRDH
jgi:hypothetical protein